MYYAGNLQIVSINKCHLLLLVIIIIVFTPLKNKLAYISFKGCNMVLVFPIRQVIFIHFMLLLFIVCYLWLSYSSDIKYYRTMIL